MTTAGQDDRRRELAETSDPRAARTRDSIVAALDELLGLDEPVSVAAVCARAGVARSTSYTHFATVGDVVVQVVDALYFELGARDVSRRSDATLTRAAITRVGLRELLGALRERRRFFLYAVSAPAAERVRERLVAELAQSVRRTLLAERPGLDEAYLRTAGDFLAGGVLSVLLGELEAEAAGADDDDLIERLVEFLPPWLTGG